MVWELRRWKADRYHLAMLDGSHLRKEPERLRASLARRGIELDLGALADLDRQRRIARTVAEELRAEQKSAGKGISQLEGGERTAAIDRAGPSADRRAIVGSCRQPATPYTTILKARTGRRSRCEAMAMATVSACVSAAPLAALVQASNTKTYYCTTTPARASTKCIELIGV